MVGGFSPIPRRNPKEQNWCITTAALTLGLIGELKLQIWFPFLFVCLLVLSGDWLRQRNRIVLYSIGMKDAWEREGPMCQCVAS